MHAKKPLINSHTVVVVVVVLLMMSIPLPRSYFDWPEEDNLMTCLMRQFNLVQSYDQLENQWE
jgi:hypothetical protein